MAASAGAERDGTRPDDDTRDMQVVSRRGSITVRVETDEAIPDGVVWLPIHQPEVNELTVLDVDPRSKEPNFKQCAVRLEVPADDEQRIAVSAASD